MKAAILAGGLGTRLSEVTERIPKPMVDIGGKPILWHIMKGYAAHGIREFILAVGHKGELVKDYFLNYRLHQSSVEVSLKTGKLTVHNSHCEDWTVHLLDTGESTQTGGRVKRVMQYAGKEPVLLTYGDGVSSVDVKKLLRFHKEHARAATITAVRPPARFGGLQFSGDLVSKFTEKPQIGEGWVNGGFFVLEPKVAAYIDGDRTFFEREPLERLAKQGQLAAYKHEGFWQCMDTLRDVRQLNALWDQDGAPWAAWKRGRTG